MEFRYRAVDVDRPPMAVPSAGSGFLSEPSIPGCNIKLPSEATCNPTEDSVWEAIRREIRKEYIRQEVIAVETARRRELVEEVIKEMAPDREMAMQGVSFEERLTMWINSRKSTNQSSLSESNKDKLIVLDRPDPKGTKRKAEASPSPAAGPEERHFLTAKKKSREEWSCALCEVNYTCERGLNEHLQGKRHKAKEVSLRAAQIPKISLGRTSKPSCFEQVGGEKQMETTEKYKAKTKPRFWCELCKVGTYSEYAMGKHETGKKHKTRIQKQKECPEASLTTLASVSPAVTTTASGVVAANTVPKSDGVTESGAEDAKKKVGDAIREGSSTEGQRVETPEKDFEKKRKFRFRCEVCDIGTHSEGVMKAHVLGKKHNSRVMKQRSPLAVLNTELASLSYHATRIATIVNSIMSSNVAYGEKWSAFAENEEVDNAVAEEVRVNHSAGRTAVEEPIEEVKGENSSVKKPRTEDSTDEKTKAEPPAIKEDGVDESVTEEARKEEKEKRETCS
ncbi:PREDICTED: UBP1-associated proteins 1C [Tarenaya hassleriana]|uniref:UBP1-associated proteins 1C n=1 Tax=Tarenaya hassleriana TaxID=28532 RepID=UPI00053C0A6A|nr:PREDICTED: UBP1-associated proteins 1C [Tarenaya hassleriana]